MSPPSNETKAFSSTKDMAAPVDGLSAITLGAADGLDAKKVDPICSACGEKKGANGSTLKKCTSCKCVWYCSKSCQREHWKDHKIGCKRIKKVLAEQAAGTRPKMDKRIADMEFDVDDPSLFDDPPPREECPVCMHTLPLDANESGFMFCCGKIVCGGCSLKHQETTHETNDEREEKGKPLLKVTCPFCRNAMINEDDEDHNAQIIAASKKRIMVGDARAMNSLGHAYEVGLHGLPIDEAKALNLIERAADLGLAEAYVKLGLAYMNGGMGLKVDADKKRKYFELAARKGHAKARETLGALEYNNGNMSLAFRHLRISAATGLKTSVEYLITSFGDGEVCFEDLAESVQANDAACLNMKSKERDHFIGFLKHREECSS